MKTTRSTWWSNRKGLCSLALIFFLLASCTPKKPPTTIPAVQIGTLGLATAAFPPRINLEEITKGRGEGAAKAGPKQVSGMIEGVAYGPSENPIAVLLALVLAPVGCIGGATYGAIAAEPAKKVRKQRKVLEKRVLALPFQRHLAENLRKFLTVNVSQEEVAGPTSPSAEVDYHTARVVETVLEAAITDVRLLNRSIATNKKISFEVRLNLRLYRTSDNALLLERSLRDKTRETSLAAWVEEGSELEEDLLWLIVNMAARVVEEAFSSSG